MKKILKYFIPIFILFIGYKVSALETLFIGNGVVLQRCTSNICQYQMSGTTNYRAVLNTTSFNVDETYTFNLNFNATTAVASPTLTDCGLNINGAYVTPQSRNSGRTSYECNQDYSRCDSAYRSTLVWTATSNLSNVPVFIQCDMTPQSATYTYTQFGYTINSNQGSVISAIDQASQNEIDTANYNANQNNANRDSNSAMIGGKIDNNTNVIGGKLDSHANTISGKLQQLIDNLTSIGSNIISAIGTGISNVINKIGELIGTQEVCTIFFQTRASNVSVGSGSVQSGYLDSNGNVNNSSTIYTTDFIDISNSYNQGLKLFTNSTNRLADHDLYYCRYNRFKALLNCSSYRLSNNPVNEDRTTTLPIQESAFYIRYSFLGANNNSTTNLSGDCHKTGLASIFNKIGNFFNSFKEFVVNLFNPNIDDAKSLGSSEFNNFTTTNVGLRGLLDTLVTFVQSIFSQSCSALVLPIPFVEDTVTLPCMSSIYTTYFPTFFSLYQLITTGLIAYRVIINLFHKVHQLEDVNYDKVEVLDL